MGKNTRYVFTVIIADVEFSTHKLDSAQAEALRERLTALGVEWQELEMGD